MWNVDNHCFEKMIDSKFPNWQIRSLDGVRLLWSLLKNPNDNVQVNDFCCHAFLYMTVASYKALYAMLLTLGCCCLVSVPVHQERRELRGHGQVICRRSRAYL